MFTTGRIIFMIFFILAFTVGMIYTYRKDLKINRIHFKGSTLILFSIILIFSILFLVVKLRH